MDVQTPRGNHRRNYVSQIGRVLDDGQFVVAGTPVSVMDRPSDIQLKTFFAMQKLFLEVLGLLWVGLMRGGS